MAEKAPFDHIPPLPASVIIDYLKMKGSDRIAQTLLRLNKEFDFIVRTDLGREILSTDINRIEELMPKLFDNSITDLEKAELHYLQYIRIPRIAAKIKTYMDGLRDVRETLHVK